MPFVTERWLGGLLTNFTTIRKSVKKMNNIEKMELLILCIKKDRLLVNRLYEKLHKNLGSISNMNHIPGGIFLVDPNKEKIALTEPIILKIPIFAMVDTNTDPNEIQYPIPSNDGLSKSIDIILKFGTEAIRNGLLINRYERQEKINKKS